jgi:hypothetical protein
VLRTLTTGTFTNLLRNGGFEQTNATAFPASVSKSAEPVATDAP